MDTAILRSKPSARAYNVYIIIFCHFIAWTVQHSPILSGYTEKTKAFIHSTFLWLVYNSGLVVRHLELFFLFLKGHSFVDHGDLDLGFYYHRFLLS
jgi:hypothetical protein